MAVIKNERDKILQAATTRLVPVPISMGQVTGLNDALSGIRGDIDDLDSGLNHLMNTTKDISIRASATTITSSTSTTLTLIRKEGIEGTPTWSVFAGTGTLTGSGDTRLLEGSSVTSASITIKCSIGTKEAYVTINKLGSLSTQNAVNLSSQVTGSLSSGNVSGLGALALLNSVNLSTQTTGALNGATQVTNLGVLAYANAIAADQIGAGTLAAGVVYAGTIAANKIGAGTITAADGITLKNGSSTIADFSKATRSGTVIGYFSLNGEMAFSRAGSNIFSNSYITGGVRISNQGENTFVNALTLTLDAAAGVIVNGTTFSGTLGQKIILRGTTYNAVINGVAGTIQITSP